MYKKHGSLQTPRKKNGCSGRTGENGCWESSLGFFFFFSRIIVSPFLSNRISVWILSRFQANLLCAYENFFLKMAHLCALQLFLYNHYIVIIKQNPPQKTLLSDLSHLIMCSERENSAG